jgi:hypothetical protein
MAAIHKGFSESTNVYNMGKSDGSHSYTLMSSLRALGGSLLALSKAISAICLKKYI